MERLCCLQRYFKHGLDSGDDSLPSLLHAILQCFPNRGRGNTGGTGTHCRGYLGECNDNKCMESSHIGMEKEIGVLMVLQECPVVHNLNAMGNKILDHPVYPDSILIIHPTPILMERNNYNL